MMALQSGSLGPEDFSNQVYLNKDRRQLTELATVQPFKVDSQFTEMSPDYSDTVTIKMKDGSSFKETIGYVKGGPNNPMSSEDLKSKYDKCSSNSMFFDQFLSSSLDENASSLLSIF